MKRECVVLASLVIILTTPLCSEEYTYYSQSGQDRLVHERCFNGVRNGFFVDIGAHDGITLSNTYFFEKNLGWRGICVEPLPAVFERLQKNRSAICVNGCISDCAGIATFLKITGYAEMLSGLVDKYDPPHRARIMRETVAHGDSAELINITCYTLHDLIKQYDISRIDYLSIDTEGGEFDIIKSIDFDEIFIDVISVEENYNGSPIGEYLKSKGYTKIGYTSEDVFYRRNTDR